MSVDLEILMPVHNEEKILPKLIKDIDESINKKISYKIIICEDGSTDNSLGVINNLKNKYPIHLITSPNKKGYSNAMLDGLKSASTDYLLIMDSDGQSNPDEILNFWDNRGKADIINGHRFNRNDYMYRKLYSKIAYVIYRILFNLKIKDPSYAYILVNKEVYSSLSSFKPEMPDGFFGNLTLGLQKKIYFLILMSFIRKEFMAKQEYIALKISKVTFYNLLGMIKIKLFS